MYEDVIHSICEHIILHNVSVETWVVLFTIYSTVYRNRLTIFMYEYLKKIVYSSFKIEMNIQ